MTDIKDGVYFDMPFIEYQNARGFSASAAKELLIDPLGYWFKKNQPYKESDKPHFVYGTALHKLLLEGESKFNDEYVCALNPDDYSDFPASNDELKEVCREHGLKVSGTKADLVSRIREGAPDVKLFADVEAEFYSFAGDRKILSNDVYDDLKSAHKALDAHDLGDTFTKGKPEVSVFWTDQNGMKCKARFDYLKPEFVIDLKSFSRKSQRPVDEVVNLEIVNNYYLIQAAHYQDAARHLSNFTSDFGDKFNFVFLFVESGPIKNVRTRMMIETEEYWAIAQSGLNKAKRTYLECKEKFGENPWIEKQSITELLDYDLPGYFMKKGEY